MEAEPGRRSDERETEVDKAEEETEPLREWERVADEVGDAGIEWADPDGFQRNWNVSN